MTKQFNDQDEFVQYKAGGIIKLYSLKRREVLLEISSRFGSSDKAKCSFDNHKGLFGVTSLTSIILELSVSTSLKKDRDKKNKVTKLSFK